MVQEELIEPIVKSQKKKGVSSGIKNVSKKNNGSPSKIALNEKSQIKHEESIKLLNDSQEAKNISPIK